MQPLRLTLKGFRGIRDGLGRDEITLDLERLADGANLIAIVGANGSGKSTIMDCLTPFIGLPSRVALAGAGGFSYYDHVYLPESVKDLTWAHEGRCYRSQIVIRLNGRRRTEAFLHTLDDAGCWRPVQLDDGMQSDGRVETYTRCVESHLRQCRDVLHLRVRRTRQAAAQHLSQRRDQDAAGRPARAGGDPGTGPEGRGNRPPAESGTGNPASGTGRARRGGSAPRRGAPKTRRRRRSRVGGRAREDGGTGRPGGRPGAARPRGGRTRAVAGYRCPAGTARGRTASRAGKRDSGAARARCSGTGRAAAAGAPRSAGRQPIAAGTLSGGGPWASPGSDAWWCLPRPARCGTPKGACRWRNACRRSAVHARRRAASRFIS
jgi:energy-coupling factor transporter ATP-binding protein EcfA2